MQKKTTYEQEEIIWQEQGNVLEAERRAADAKRSLVEREEDKLWPKRNVLMEERKADARRNPERGDKLWPQRNVHTEEKRVVDVRRNVEEKEEDNYG